MFSTSQLPSSLWLHRIRGGIVLVFIFVLLNLLASCTKGTSEIYSSGKWDCKKLGETLNHFQFKEWLALKGETELYIICLHGSSTVYFKNDKLNLVSKESAEKEYSEWNKDLSVSPNYAIITCARVEEQKYVITFIDAMYEVDLASDSFERLRKY